MADDNSVAGGNGVADDSGAAGNGGAANDSGAAGDRGIGEGPGKRVSWAELYFDLIFVFAVGQSAHVIVAEPDWHGLGMALGLFATLWWTWIGYVVLYNRSGEDRAMQRLFLLAGTIPCAIAAVEVHSAASGHLAGFAFALAGARLVLALAFLLQPGTNRFTGRRVAIGYAASTVVFAASVVVPSPWRYVLWALTLIQEAGFLLMDAQRLGAGARPARESREQRRQRRQRERSEQRGHPDQQEHTDQQDQSDQRAQPGQGSERRRRQRATWARTMFAAPTDPSLAVDAAHLAERFGLFMIILLGEIVVSVGASALEVHAQGATYWLNLLAGLVLAAALWWIYFDSAAEINEYVLRASGGNPSMAYGLYAGGHLAPAFSLLVVAAGVNLVLTEHPPATAAWLVSAGLGGYLLGTRAVGSLGRWRLSRVIGLVTVAATVCLAFLRPLLTTTGVLAVVTAWAIGVALFVSWQRPARLSRVTADPFSLFGR